MNEVPELEDSQEAMVEQARMELAAAFRLVALLGWDDHVVTHMSARLHDGSFLLNPFGLMFSEVTPANLTRVSTDGTMADGGSVSTLNPAAFNLHSGVLTGRPDVGCVIHLHTLDGVAVSALETGLLPLSQNALNIWSDVAYHKYEGVVSAKEEQESLNADLGTKNLMILRNHGTLATGRSIASAFYRIYSLEWACTAQVRTLSMGQELSLPEQDVIDGMFQQEDASWVDQFAEELFWPAMLRRLDRDEPGWHL